MARRPAPRTIAKAKGELRARDLMTKKPVVATIPGTRTDVLRLLVKHRLTGVPVVRKDGGLAGFVARAHIFAKPDEEQLAMVMARDHPAIEDEATMTECATVLVEMTVYYLPVVHDGKLVGIITPSDMLKEIAKRNIETPVERLIRSPCVAMHASTPINVASEIMRHGRVTAAPILGDDGHLAGIVTDRDVFALSRVNGTIAQRELGIAADEDAWAWEGLRNVMRLYWEEKKIELPRSPVRDIMSKPVTVFRKTSASEAARTMVKNDFGQLPVVDSQDRLEAMLYELDLLTVLMQRG